MRTLIVSGYLGRDAEVNTTPKGNKVLKVVIASNEFGDPKKADGTNNPLWINISSFKEGEIRNAQYFKKGSNVIIIGDLKVPTIYTNKNNEAMVNLEMANCEIKFNNTGSKKENDTTHSNENDNTSNVKPADMNISVNTPPASIVANDATDDLPF